MSDQPYHRSFITSVLHTLVLYTVTSGKRIQKLSMKGRTKETGGQMKKWQHSVPELMPVRNQQKEYWQQQCLFVSLIPKWTVRMVVTYLGSLILVKLLRKRFSTSRQTSWQKAPESPSIWYSGAWGPYPACRSPVQLLALSRLFCTSQLPDFWFAEAFEATSL